MKMLPEKISLFVFINAFCCQTAIAAEKTATDSFLPMVLQSVAALSAVLGLFAIVVWLMRRLQGLSPNRVKKSDLHIVQRLSLGGKHSLAIVACGEQQWLIALSPNTVTRVSQLDVKESRDETAQADQYAG